MSGQVQEGSVSNNGGICCIEPTLPQKKKTSCITISKITTEGTKQKSKASRHQKGINILKKVTALVFKFHVSPPLFVSSFEGRARSAPLWKAAKTHRNSSSYSAEWD